MAKRTCYVWDQNLLEQCDRLPAVTNRASMIHSLITAYKLTEKMQIVNSVPATVEDLKLFHTERYLDHIKILEVIDEDYMSHTQDEEFGIGYDCPPVCEMYKLVSVIAGGSITAAKCLLLGIADVAINWCGGWHHAQRSGAEGFCYVNDIVLCIEKLKQKFQRVLYIDLDVHHGNGVQDAYNLSKSVFTLSLHKYEAGFYPGTGCIDDIGNLTGKGFMCNVPLYAAYCDDTFEYVFEKIFEKVYEKFEPEAVVVQCGADALARDPNGGAGLTTKSYCKCIRDVLNKNKPTVLLGGGGYNHSNAARLWASITALVVGVDLDENIPEHDYWPQYGPDFMLNIHPLLTKDENSRKYLDHCIARITDNLEKHLGSNTRQKHKKCNHDAIEEDNSEIVHMSNQFKKYKMTLYHNNMTNTESDTSKTDVYNFIE
ncbi:unnamed protein product [Colias eurytheme]|nr:unnamed protein product [Colias eurytheme]